MFRIIFRHVCNNIVFADLYTLFQFRVQSGIREFGRAGEGRRWVLGENLSRSDDFYECAYASRVFQGPFRYFRKGFKCVARNQNTSSAKCVFNYTAIWTRFANLTQFFSIFAENFFIYIYTYVAIFLNFFYQIIKSLGIDSVQKAFIRFPYRKKYGYYPYIL